jgi:hypothetical protein
MMSRAARRLSLLLVAVVVCLACSTAQAELVAYWNLDDNTDDISGNGNNGAIMGGVSYDADVPTALGAGKSANFDGAAGTYVNVTQNAMLPITTQSAFTISMWVKGDGTVDNVDDRVFSEAMTTDSNPLFNLGTQNQGADGRFDFYFRNGDSPNHQYSVAEPFDNTWHHVAWVDTDHVGTLYVDGVEDTTFDYASFVNENFAPDTTTIGGILRADDCCNFTGNIDDVAIYNVALSAANIGQLASGVSPLLVPEPSSLVLAAIAIVGLLGLMRRRD